MNETKDKEITGLLNSYDVIFLKQKDNLEFDSIKFSKYGEWGCFSNFHMLNNHISYDGILYPSTEHFFQAMKTTDDTQRKLIASLPTPQSAKSYCSKKSGNIKIRENWEEIKYSVMYWAVKEKFTKDKSFKEILLKTEHSHIVEWTWWGDTIWGMDSKTGTGNNALGKILKMVRDKELQA